MIKGIDISQWQGGNIDFNLLKQNESFVMIRANYGTPDNGTTLNEDADFQRNRAGARAAGIPHGFYHYCYPEYNTPEAEADFFASLLSDIQQGEILAPDWEEPYSGDHVAWVKAFLDRLSSHFNGYKPLVYMNLNECATHDWQSVIAENYGLWLAAWDGTTSENYPTVPWSFLAIKQYADNTQVPGISGNVDGDVFYGDVGTLEKYGYQPPAPAPAPQPAPTPAPTFTQADIDAAFQKGVASMQSQIDSLTQQLKDAQATVTQDTSIIQQDENTISQDKVTEDNLVQQVQTLKNQVTTLTTELQTKGQIVHPLQENESVIQRVVDFFDSLMSKGVK